MYMVSLVDLCIVLSIIVCILLCVLCYKEGYSRGCKDTKKEPTITVIPGLNDLGMGGNSLYDLGRNNFMD